MIFFLGIGAQKAGTTWLYEMLRLHPQINFPAGKEVHFWDQHYWRGIDWYKSLFIGGEKSNLATGEITPAYAIIPPDKIQECYAHFPNLKLVYVLRNPIERAWSSAKMALARAEMKTSEASDQWFIDHFRSGGSMARGDYEQCIRNWLSYYPRRQMLICLFDHLQSDPEGLLRRCFDHLGADQDKYDWSSDLRKRVFPTTERALPHQLRSELQTIYRSKIESLAEYLQTDLTTWADAF